MAIKLNLLPPEATVSGPLAKVLKTIRMFNVVFLAGFIIFAVGVGAFFIISSIQLKNFQSIEDQLVSQISAQEDSEQQFVLLKDRLGKIRVVQNIASGQENMARIEPFLLTVGNSSSVSELDVDSQKIDMSVRFTSNSDLTGFLQMVGESDTFRAIVLSSFGYNPASGYLVGIHLQ